MALLDSLSVDSDDVWWYWVVLVALFFVFRLIGSDHIEPEGDQVLLETSQISRVSTRDERGNM